MTIDFKPTIKQHQLFEAFDNESTTELVYGGSAGSAKSYGISALIILKCLEHPGIRVGLARNELTTLKKTTVISFMEVINNWGIKHLVNYNSTAGIIKFENGSEVILMELRYLPNDSEYSRLGGHLLTFGCIDEIGEVNERGYSIFKTRLGRWKNAEFDIKPICISTCNPTKNWLYREFYKKFIDGVLESHKMYIQALPTDNPYLPQSYLDNLNRLPFVDRQRLLLGNWEYDELEDSLMTYTDILEIFENVNIDNSEQGFISADIAMRSDRMVIIRWIGLTIVEIIIDPPTDKIEDFILELANKHKIPTKNISYDRDGIGGLLDRRLGQSYGINNGGKPLYGENYDNLKTQLHYKLAEVINSYQLKCLVKTHIEDMTMELQQVRSKVSKDVGKIAMISKDEVKKFLGRSPDISDAMAYRCIFEIKKKVRRPF